MSLSGKSLSGLAQMKRGLEEEQGSKKMARNDYEVDERETPARRWHLANQSVEANPGLPSGFVLRAVAFLSMNRPWEAVRSAISFIRVFRWRTWTERCGSRRARLVAAIAAPPTTRKRAFAYSGVTPTRPA